MKLPDLVQGLQVGDFGADPPEWTDRFIRRFNALSAGLTSLTQRGISPSDNFTYPPITITVSHGVASTFKTEGPVGGVLILGAVGTDGATRMVQTFGCWNSSRRDTVNCIFYFHDSEASNVQVTLLPLEEGILGGKAPDSPLYLIAGTIDVAIIKTTASNGGITYIGNKNAADVGTDHVFDTTNTRSAGNLLSIRNAGTDKAYFDKDGNLGVGGGFVSRTTSGALALQGYAADGASAVGVYVDTVQATLANATAKLLSIRNNTVEKAYFDKGGALYADSYLPFAAGAAFIFGRIANGGTAVGVVLDNTVTLSTSGAKLVSFRNNGSEKSCVDKDGFFQSEAYRGYTTSAKVQGVQADSGSSVGVILDTSATYSTSGAKLASFRNNGTEKLYVAFGGGLSNSDNNFFGGVYINTGGVLDANGATTLTIGSGNATALNIGKAAVTTTIKGLFATDTANAGGIVQETWSGLSYGASWSDYDSNHYGIGYMKDSQGFVRLRGAAKYNGATPAGTTVGTLPSGYRPASGKRIHFAVATYTGAVFQGGVVTIYDTGVVEATVFTHTGANNGALILDGLNFDTR